ncbi:MAG: 3D domain-containing protein [Eubacteriales bacterium]|nr:3D domain-containing protein [Eubacteriales bacterium]
MRNNAGMSEIYKSTYKLLVLIVVGMIFSSIFVGGVDYSSAKTVNLTKDGNKTVVTTFAGTVDEFIIAQGLKAEGFIANESKNASIRDGMALDIKTRRTKAVTSKRKIDYKQVRVANNKLVVGETKVIQQGVIGIAEDIYSVEMLGEEEIERTLISTATKLEPLNEIVEYGTKDKDDKGFKYSKMFTVKATAYESTFGSRNGRPGITASGLPLKVGMIAVDPRLIPLGSKCYIEDPNGAYNFGYVIAADTGGAIKGNRIDVCVPTYNDAIQFGVRNLNVYVLD